MTIKYKAYKGYKEELLDLYASVGWTNYTNQPEMLKKAYEHSLSILGAYDEDKLIGIIRVVGDGHSIVYIQDILVNPDYQRRGIGRYLLDHILESYKDVYQKVLMTNKEEKTIQFYQSLGFTADYDIDCVGFFHFGE